MGFCGWVGGGVLSHALCELTRKDNDQQQDGTHRCYGPVSFVSPGLCSLREDLPFFDIQTRCSSAFHPTFDAQMQQSQPRLGSIFDRDRIQIGN